MPYIVTTKRPDAQPYNPAHANIWHPVSRLAVATLKEAVSEVKRAVKAIATETGRVAATTEQAMAIVALSESGGTVGPLPDGTVIVVEPRGRSVLYGELPVIVRARFGSWANMTDEQVCSAWNANAPAREGAAH